jgi:CDP-glucose 4,6-dehydratase
MKLFSCFNNKTVLITGHTGFKGSWLSMWMNQLGANVVGVSIDIPSDPSHFDSAKMSKKIDDHCFDILDAEGLKRLVYDIQPDFVFHLAAQALVRPSYHAPVETIMTNAIGTVNVLDALRSLDKKVVAIMITSDKAYDNVEWVWGYRETDRLGGSDPYSASKGMAELAIRSFIDSYFDQAHSDIRLGIARAGNVIGGGDWAMDRIVPDCMQAWSNNQAVDIRSPHATRPWQHVLEPLNGYLLLAENLSQSVQYHGEAYNFGPPAHQNHSVSELINEMGKYWNKVQWNNTSEDGEHFHEAGLLKLNCDKSLFDLQWESTLNFTETVEMTVEWYKHYYQNPCQSMYDFTMNQIELYTKASKLKNTVRANND